ncbi:MAG: polyprenyl diphosphate synthase [bacterium]|nr:polyprenyl diphosphate synthase [bacterium]
MKSIRSIGIIMDGNRRWAKARGRLSFEGHRAGLDTLKKLGEELPRLKSTYGLEYVTLYAFSTENWNRSPEELAFLMKLFESAFADLLKTLERGKVAPEKKFRLRVVGQKERFSPKLQALMADVEAKTADFSEGTVFLALSYGGRAEILNAVLALVEKGGKNVTEESFAKHLWTSGMPDPDLIIRTGGEKRLSNFLTWQGVYSELFFTDTFWPDFSVTEVENIFKEFQGRERRRGK